MGNPRHGRPVYVTAIATAHRGRHHQRRPRPCLVWAGRIPSASVLAFLQRVPDDYEIVGVVSDTGAGEVGRAQAHPPARLINRSGQQSRGDVVHLRSRFAGGGWNPVPGGFVTRGRDYKDQGIASFASGCCRPCRHCGLRLACIGLYEIVRRTGEIGIRIADRCAWLGGLGW